MTLIHSGPSTSRALGGFAFDALFFIPPAMNLGKRSRRLYMLVSSAISGLLDMAPYLLFRFSVLGLFVFLTLIPIYALSTIKGTLFSIVGTSLGLYILPRLKLVLTESL